MNKPFFLVLSPHWMLMIRPGEGIVEYKTVPSAEGDQLHTMKLQDHMLPQWRKMVYEWCVSTAQCSHKVTEIHNWLLHHTGKGL